VTEPEIFGAVVGQAKNALDGNPVERRVEVERQIEAAKSEEPPEAAAETPEAEAEDEVIATDAAARKAEEIGVDLSAVEGSGQAGRITVGDVEKATARPSVSFSPKVPRFSRRHQRHPCTSSIGTSRSPACRPSRPRPVRSGSSRFWT
jgi:pyruvate dehydrogenase E2 component (dihydrolipoamide acetyltransferase)